MPIQIDQAVEILWNAAQQGKYFPEALHGKLTLQDAYRVQLGMLQRTVAAGAKQAGWKIGLSADSIRSMYGVSDPVSGYLLASRGFPGGSSFTHADLIRPAIEAELCFTLTQDLRGPGVTRDQVLSSVGSVAAAFEIINMRGNMTDDLPLGVADNVAQWAYVTGAEVRPYPHDLDLDEVTVEVICNGETAMRGKGAEVIDNQIRSIAWLANNLSEYGAALSAGQCIMTGSFNKPLPVNQGDAWEARFSTVGSVSASFT